MNKAAYDAHVDTIRAGAVVHIEGRSAVTTEQLNFAIKASGDTLPVLEEADPPRDLNGDGQVDDLEKMKYQDLFPFAAALGLTIKGGTSRASTIEQIREFQTQKQALPHAAGVVPEADAVSLQQP